MLDVSASIGIFLLLSLGMSIFAKNVVVLDNSPSKIEGDGGSMNVSNACTSMSLSCPSVTMLGRVAMPTAPHAELCSTRVLQSPRALSGS